MIGRAGLDSEVEGTSVEWEEVTGGDSKEDSLDASVEENTKGDETGLRNNKRGLRRNMCKRGRSNGWRLKRRLDGWPNGGKYERRKNIRRGLRSGEDSGEKSGTIGEDSIKTSTEGTSAEKRLNGENEA